MTKKRHFLATRLLLSLLALLTATMAGADNVTVTSETTSWTDGNTYIVTSDVTIDSRISVSGTVKLDINEDATLTALQGINVPESTTLTINETGTGTLTAFDVWKIGSELIDGAAIGGKRGCNTGTINIKGGTINATSQNSNYAAAIGGGYGWTDSELRYGSAGTINISGGTINATSKSSGAAIGTGSNGTGGVVNISGGTITASNTSNGAAIGDGYTTNSTSISSISISGGIINATTKGSYSAAIGGYYSSNGGTITISGGKITATGEFTGIGAGKNCSETASTTVTIGLTDAEDYIDINSYLSLIHI